MKNQRRIIIKVGSSSLVLENGQLNNKFFSRLIKTISFLIHEGHIVVLVTSGAIAVGMGKLGLTKKPKEMALKQACAALGQAILMNEYEKYTSIDNILCAQILVNHDDFENRNRMMNLSNTLESLFENNILPIINENDALAVEEIKADAGIDIGFTLIGMHLKKVAVPVRLSVDHLGEAIILCARVRPKFIGGVRAVYDENLL